MHSDLTWAQATARRLALGMDEDEEENEDEEKEAKESDPGDPRLPAGFLKFGDSSPLCTAGTTSTLRLAHSRMGRWNSLPPYTCETPGFSAFSRVFLGEGCKWRGGVMVSLALQLRLHDLHFRQTATSSACQIAQARRCRERAESQCMNLIMCRYYAFVQTLRTVISC